MNSRDWFGQGTVYRLIAVVVDWLQGLHASQEQRFRRSTVIGRKPSLYESFHAPVDSLHRMQNRQEQKYVQARPSLVIFWRPDSFEGFAFLLRSFD